MNFVGLLVSIVNIKTNRWRWLDNYHEIETVVGDRRIAIALAITQNIFQAAACQVSHSLMVYSYRKGLSEEWYS